MDIRKAIENLDPANDEHWTNAGLPAVNAVSDAVGENVSRQQIAEAYPGYDRAKAEDERDGRNQEGPQPPSADEEGMAVDNETQPVGDEPEGALPDGTFPIDEGLVEKSEAGSDNPYSEDPGDGLKVGKHDEDPDAIVMIEDALRVAQGERYMRNYELQAFVRQWSVQQTLIRESQRRIDARNSERGKR